MPMVTNERLAEINRQWGTLRPQKLRLADFWRLGAKWKPIYETVMRNVGRYINLDRRDHEHSGFKGGRTGEGRPNTDDGADGASTLRRREESDSAHARTGKD